MSLYGALTIGVSALQAQSNAIGIVSNNISNSTTVGYKEGAPSFADLIDQAVPYGGPDKSGNSSALGYFPSGVKGSAAQLNDIQGAVTSGKSATDIAISGSGFIPVSQTTTSGSNLLYTRAGAFGEDANGNLVNTAGFYLQGYAINNGVTGSTLQTVNVQGLNETPVPTTAVTVQTNLNASQAIDNAQIAIQANLQSTQVPYSGVPVYSPTNPTANMASGSIAPQFTTPVTLVDSQGTSHNFTVGYLNTGANTWQYEVYAQPATDVTAPNGQVAYGTLSFNSDGSLAGVAQVPAQSVPINWTDGAAATGVAFNWGTSGQTNGLSQLNSAYTNTGVTIQAYNAASSTTDMASGAVAPQFSEPVTVIDNTGATHTVDLDFLKTGTNTWSVEVNAQPATDVVSANGGQLAAGTVTFNGDGTLASISPSLTQPITATWQSGATASNITFNWGTSGIIGTGQANGLSQFSSAYTNNTTQNGIQPGTLTGVAITANGDVTASYSNSSTQNIYQVPLASFVDPDQLQAQSGNVFAQSTGSGPPVFTSPGQNGVGTLDPNALESSNVDLSSQLTDLIVAQNAYQAGSKLVSTSDTMLSDLVSMGAT